MAGKQRISADDNTKWVIDETLRGVMLRTRHAYKNLLEASRYSSVLIYRSFEPIYSA